MSEATRQSKPIQIAIMCNGRSFPAWQARVIGSLLDLDGAEVSLLIIRKGTVGGKRSRLVGMFRDWTHLFWTAYNKGYVERRSEASRPVDLSERLTGVTEIECLPLPVGKYGEKLGEADIEAIASHDLDVILRFAFGILKGEVLTTARHGVWSFHHGDERVYRGQPPGFWEVYNRSPVVGAILQRITERLDGGTVLRRGTFRTNAHSYRRTRDEVFFGAADFVSIAVRQILDGDKSAVDSPPSTTTAPLLRSPTNVQMLVFLLRQANAFMSAQWRGLTRASKWSIGVIEEPITSFVAGQTAEVTWMPEQGRDRYLADPFPDPTGESDVVLFEDFDHAGRRGVISAMDSRSDRRARTVLDAGVHASYPYLFEADGDVFCTPETYQATAVRLYRAIRFPDRWELVTTILDGVPALDPTVFRHNGLWWLFCTLEGPYANVKLHVFSSSSLAGPWSPHPLNPVKSDVTSSRPAGTPFVHEGALYRPAQDSSRSYGGGITINRIEELTPTRFEETLVHMISPPDRKYPHGIHTISGVGNRTVIDGRRDFFNLSSFRHELAGRLRRLRRSRQA